MRAALPLLVGAAAGALFAALHAPLPWMLGPLFALMAWSVVGTPQPPRGLMALARPVVGVTAGAAFTPDVVAAAAAWWPALVLVLVLLVAALVAGFVFFRTVVGLPKTTAFFAALPGGLTEMSALGAAAGADLRTLVMAHAVRMVLTVITVTVTLAIFAPDLVRGPRLLGPMPDALGWALLIGCAVVGGGIGHAMGSASAAMLLPMGSSAAVHLLGVTDAHTPGWLVAVVQVMIGVAAGARFAGADWRVLGRVALLSAGWAVVLMVAAVLTGLVGAAIAPIPLVPLLLGLAPGGMAEMVVIALALQQGLAVVVACHVFRLFVILAGAPLAYRLLRRWLR